MTTKKCPYCAEEIKTEAIKCKHCKQSLSSNKIINATCAPKSKEVAGKWKIGIIFVAIISVLILTSYLSSPVANPTNSSVLIDDSLNVTAENTMQKFDEFEFFNLGEGYLGSHEWQTLNGNTALASIFLEGPSENLNKISIISGGTFLEDPFFSLYLLRIKLYLTPYLGDDEIEKAISELPSGTGTAIIESNGTILEISTVSYYIASYTFYNKNFANHDY